MVGETKEKQSQDSLVSDTAERKLVHEAVQASEARLRAIVENASYAMGLSASGNHILVNPAYLRLFGYDNPNELIGKPFFDLVAPEERPSIMENERRRARGESVPSAFEARGLRRDETCFDMMVTVSVYELQGQVYSTALP